jgi:hypothetical protein
MGSRYNRLTQLVNKGVKKYSNQQRMASFGINEVHKSKKESTTQENSMLKGFKAGMAGNLLAI